MPPYDDLWPAASAPAEPLKLLDRKYSRQFCLEQARAFVWGQQPTIANFLPEPARPTRRRNGLRDAAGPRPQPRHEIPAPRDLPPTAPVRAPKSTSTSPASRSTPASRAASPPSENQPLALAAAWRAPDGHIAIAVARSWTAR